MAKLNPRERLQRFLNSRTPGADANSDLGFGTGAAAGRNTRLINRQGQFTVRRLGLRFWDRFSPFHDLINMSWARFALIIVSFYFVFNLFFAAFYWLLGDGAIEGMKGATPATRFVDLFFFSTQTFTTVGYGVMHPVGLVANLLSSIESLLGWLSFAVASGLVYGRFARPTAKILFSDAAVVAPYKDITAFMFRVVNGRSNQLIEVEAQLSFSYVDRDATSQTQRKFLQLPLERARVSFFPTNWTLVHAIDANSPLAGFSLQDLQELDAEFLIMLKAFDDTFAQVVHARGSYKAENLLWGHKFVPMYGFNHLGEQELWLDKLSHTEAVPLPEIAIKTLTGQA
jgi:inward rectifier potassium channel